MSSTSTSFKIVNVHVFNGQCFSKGDVYVKDGLISAASKEITTTVDGTDKYLIPGLIDGHIHLRTDNVLNKLARGGVTTALDMGDWPAAHYHSLKNQMGLPDIRSAGPPATCPGSLHSKFPGIDDYLIQDISQVDEWVAKRVEEGSDYIKLISDVPGPSQEMLNALVAASRRHNKKVVVHAARKVAFEMAVEAQPDFITHLPLDQPLDANTGPKMKAKGIACVPTLVMEQKMSSVRGPPLNYAAAKASFELLHEAGVHIVAGTDANGSDFCPIEHGSSLHREMELMVDAGLSTLEALKSGTEAAHSFGLSDRGKIKEGLRADLVLLGANPIEDIGNLKSIGRVWIAGTEYDLS